MRDRKCGCRNGNWGDGAPGDGMGAAVGQGCGWGTSGVPRGRAGWAQHEALGAGETRTGFLAGGGNHGVQPRMGPMCGHKRMRAEQPQGEEGEGGTGPPWVPLGELGLGLPPCTHLHPVGLFIAWGQGGVWHPHSTQQCSPQPAVSCTAAALGICLT